jgi:hypothetical protein
LPAMRLPNRKSVLLLEPSVDDLKSTCYVLNTKEPARLCSELRRLVKAWLESGPDLKKMLEADKVLSRNVRHGRTLLVATGGGRGHLLWLPNPPCSSPASWDYQALAMFMDLIVHPYWEKLGGPCARCGDYYIKKTRRQKVYCSQRCGSATTAIPATRRKRAEEHAEKLRRAQVASAEWITTRTKDGWKDWTSSHTGITMHWLTRAVSNGELRPPTEKG